MQMKIVEESSLLSLDEIKSGTLVQAISPGLAYNGHVYLKPSSAVKVSGSAVLINLTTGGNTFFAGSSEKIFKPLPAGTIVQLTQD